MHPLVVIHGAFGGGWEWTPVAERLRAEGVRVFTPTLSGLGERAHLGAATVGLGWHVADVVACLEMEDLEDVVLCAASYGGMPVAVAASRVEPRLAHIVYLDALVPRNGESAADLLPRWFGEAVRLALATHGPGHRVPVPEVILPPVGSVREDVRLRYVARLRPQPVLTFVEPAQVLPTRVPTTFVRCTASGLGPGTVDPIAAMPRRARAAGWDYREIDATHDPHLSNPDAVVALLKELTS